MLTGSRNSLSLKNLLAFAHSGRRSREGRARTGGSPVLARCMLDLVRIWSRPARNFRSRAMARTLALKAVRVAANILRDRASDVLRPTELATRHHAYRCRVMMGPSYRADMWATLEGDPILSVAALARRTHGSFATAWHVRRDFGHLRQVHRRPPLAG